MQKTKQILATLAIIISLFLVNQAIMAWTTPTGAPPSSNAAAPLNVSSTAQTKSGGLYSSTDMRAPIFYDQNNTGYYTDPASNSWLYRIYSYDVRSDIFYDRNNTGYYVDPASTSNFNTVQAVSFLYSSDESLKKNISVIPNALDRVLKLEGVSFQWKDNNRNDLGLIAQDVEKVFPELVQTDETTGLKSVEYGNLVAPLIEAVKEQQKEIKSLNERIEKLEKKQSQ